MFFLFVTALVSLAVTTIVMHILSRYTKLKSLATSTALQQIREAGAVSKQKHISVECTLKCNGTQQLH